MDIERLTKTQIVLLTLLVSFVTSIATGIVTVTLLEQAPPAVTQTINRVVERTVERVVPDTQGANVVTKETTTVVVKENDLITDSIAKNAKNLVRVSEVGEAGKTTFLGLGSIVSRDGVVATDSFLISNLGRYRVATFDGQTFEASVLSKEKDTPTALLKIVKKEGEKDVVFSPAAFADLTALKLGQTVVAVSGRERTNVALGIISGLSEREIPPPKDKPTDPPTKELIAIETDLRASDVLLGTPLLNIFGDVIGMYTASSEATSGGIAFTPVTAVHAQLLKLAAATAPSTSSSGTQKPVSQ